EVGPKPSRSTPSSSTIAVNQTYTTTSTSRLGSVGGSDLPMRGRRDSALSLFVLRHVLPITPHLADASNGFITCCAAILTLAPRNWKNWIANGRGAAGPNTAPLWQQHFKNSRRPSSSTAGHVPGACSRSPGHAKHGGKLRSWPKIGKAA